MELSLDIQSVSGTRRAQFPIRRVYNLGSATRDPAVAVPHQEEVAKEGVQIALDVPAPRIYPMPRHLVRTDDELFVHCDETSGEVEIVLLVADRLYVGVGSDHTDRALERTSILWSKAVNANILAPVIWPWEDVAARWDQMVLRSWVDGRLYQDVGVNAFLSPADMLAVLRQRVASMPERDFIVFGGTYVSVDKTLGYGRRWEFALDDPAGGRTIRHGYDVINIMDEMAPGYRVPLFNPKRG